MSKKKFSSSSELSDNNESAVVMVGTAAATIRTNYSAATRGSKTQARPTQTEPKLTGSSTVSPWGDDNLFPQTIIEEARKSTIIPPTLEWKAHALYGGGIMYGMVDGYDENNNEIFKRDRNTDIELFFRKSNIRRYLIESITDFYWFYNAFPELITSAGEDKIVSISANAAEDCRFKKRNSKGIIETVYASAKWTGTGLPDDAVEIPVVDVYYDPVAHAQEKGWKKFIYPLSYPTPGSNYYQMAPWNGARESGWYDVAQAIPTFKKSLFENQLTIKYHIDIADWYWTWKYKEWREWSGPEQRAKIKAEIDSFEKLMAGTEKAGKSLMTSSHYNVDKGTIQPGWKITPIDNKIKDGIYIEDSQEASSHLLASLGVHSTLTGIIPGGKGMGAGSGSDQRVSFNNYISLCESHRDIILEPLNFIRDYNGWPPDTEFRFRAPMIMTLDKGKQTQQEAA